MKILISEEDWVDQQRIMDLHTRFNGIQILFEQPNVSSIILAIRSIHPNVIIIGTQLSNENILDIIENTPTLIPPPTQLIFIRETPNSEIHENLNGHNLTFIDNTALGFQKLILILRKIQSQLNCGRVVFPDKKNLRSRKKLIWHKNPGDRMLSWR